MNGSKGQISSPIPVGFLIGVLIGFLIVTLFAGYFIVKDPVSFYIRLDQQNIPKGVDGVLLFGVKNYKFSEITNLTVTNEVIDQDSQFSLRRLINLGFLDDATGAYVFDTSDMGRGNYIIKSVLTYNNEDGSQETKELTLGINII